MTNPDNIVRVRARNGGRASVYEANGWAQSYSAGLFEGDGVIQNTVADMNVLVGGSSSKPDVVLAENPAGYKIALDLVGQQPIAITAPASNNRISSIVAYTDDLSLATTEDTVTGSPASCGLIVVNGTASVNPTEPTDAQIRTAITNDGATGSQSAYVIIANILVSSNTTAITDSLIVTNRATLNVTNNIAPSSITANKLDFTTYAKRFENNGETPVSLSTSYGNVNKIEGLKAGTYLVILDSSYRQTTGSTKNVLVRFSPTAGTNSHETVVNVLDGGTSYWNHNVVADSVILTTDGDITIQMRGEAAINVNLLRYRAYAIRIA